jgi:hypothetical protein
MGPERFRRSVQSRFFHPQVAGHAPVHPVQFLDPHLANADIDRFHALGQACDKTVVLDLIVLPLPEVVFQRRDCQNDKEENRDDCKRQAKGFHQ